MFLKSSEGLTYYLMQRISSVLEYNNEGGRRVSLVAWSRITQPKFEGGLGLKDLRSHANALLAKWLPVAVDSPQSSPSKWTRMLEAHFLLFRWDNFRITRSTRHDYNLHDKILMCEARSLNCLQYMFRLWLNWLILCRN